MKTRRFLPPLLLLLQPVFFNNAYAHTISSSLGHSYGTIYTVLYFIGKILPFAGLGILAQFPARIIGYKRLLWEFCAMLGAGILLGHHFHDYLSTAYFNYFLTVVIGFLVIFYSGRYNTALRSFIILSFLPLGFDFGLHFSHADAWQNYMIAICAAAIAVFIGFSKLFTVLSGRFQWVQQMIGIILVIAGILLILLF